MCGVAQLTLTTVPEFSVAKMGTVLLTTSGMFKIIESFAVFTLLVMHRIGNQGYQVRQDSLKQGKHGSHLDEV